ncbi:MAG: hypothetical protein M0029_10695 [Actinomycetota bacterium]|jgi:hypothetical protein|nr:hypothetical protein [Actinomycetota bacterium]
MSPGRRPVADQFAISTDLRGRAVLTDEELAREKVRLLAASNNPPWRLGRLIPRSA